MQRRTYLQALGIGTATIGATGLASAGRRSADRGGDDGPRATVRSIDQSHQFEEDAAVACGPVTVVTGTIVAANGCEEPAVADVDLTDGRLRLELETVDDTGRFTVCTQALVGHEYVATVTGYDDTPDEVVVAHGETVVARESCDGSDGVFVTTGTGTDTEDDATVLCGPVPVVKGTIVAPDECSEPTLAAVDESDGTVRFVVETERPDDADVCAQRVTSHDYLAAAPNVADPDEIAVVHDGETVAETDCGADEDGNGDGDSNGGSGWLGGLGGN